jgi:hypothetical protein
VVVVVIVLVVTNLASLGALLYFRYGPEQHPRPDGQVAAAIDRATPRGAAGAIRRVITVEILNPIELAATRGRLVGMAGSLAPGLTRRIVYDQAVRNMKRQLAEEHVVADVRVYRLEHDGPDARSQPDPERDERSREELAVRASASELALSTEVSTRAQRVVAPREDFGG